MKLHLPKSLRTAVLTCIAVAGGVTTTVGTGILTGGVLTIAFSVSQAQAETITAETTWSVNDTSHTGQSNTIDGATLIISGGTTAAPGQTYDYGEIILTNNSTLRLNMWGTGASDVHDVTLGTTRPIILSDITLDGSTIHFLDGSYQFKGDVKVKGTSTLVSDWSKGYMIENLSSDGEAVLNLNINSHGWAASVEYGVINAGDFTGSVNMNNSSDATEYLVLGHKTALGDGTTIVNTGNRGNKNVISLNTSEVNLKSVTGNGLIQICERSGNAGITAATVNLSAASGTFSGTVAAGVTMNVKAGALTLGGCNIEGALVVGSGASAALTSALTVSGSVTLGGTIDLASAMGATAETTVNGFTNTYFTLLTAASTGTLNADGVTSWTVDGEAVEASLAGGVLTLTGGPVKIYTVAEAGSTVLSSGVTGETGYLITGAGATLDLDDSADIANLTSGIEVAVGADNKATIEISNGVSLTNAAITKTSGTINLTVKDGGTFTSDYASGAPVYNGTLTVLGGGHVVLNNNDALGWGSTGTAKVVLEGTDEKKAVLSAGGRLTFSAALEMKGNALIDSNGKSLDPVDGDYGSVSGLDMYNNGGQPGTIVASGKNNEIAINIYGRDGSPDPVTFDVAADSDLTISGAVTQRVNGPTNFAKAGEGLLTLSSDATSINGLFSNLAGTTDVTGDAAFNGGLDIAAGSIMNLGTASTAITLGGPVTNAGTLVIKGTVNIADVSRLTVLPAGYTDGVNGFEIVAGYSLIEGEDTVDLTDATFMYEGKEVTLAYANGAYSFAPADAEVGTDYYLNTGKLALDGTKADVEAATSYVLAENTELIVTAASTAANPLLNSTGAGNIVLQKDVQLVNAQSTAVTGSLTIGEGATLSIGSGDTQTVSVESFSSIILDGGSIYYQNSGGVLNNLSVTAKGGTYQAEDMGTGLVSFAGTTDLVGDFTINATWNTQIGIESLAGSGDLTANRGTSSANDNFSLSINASDNYSGDMTFKSVDLTLGENFTSAGSLNVIGGYNAIDDSAVAIAGDLTTTGAATFENVKLTIGASNLAFGGGLTIKGGSQTINTGSLTVTANVTMENSSWAPWDARGTAGAEIKFVGSMAGGGNFINHIQDATYTFAGDTSAWTPGNFRAVADTTAVFSGTTIINANNMRAEGGHTLNLVIDNANAVTVKGNVGTTDGFLNVDVKQAGNVTFEGTLIAGGTITGNGGQLILGDLNLKGTDVLDLLHTEALNSDASNGFIAVKKLIATGFSSVDDRLTSVGSVDKTLVNANGQLYYVEEAGTIYQVITDAKLSDISSADQTLASAYAVAQDTTLVLDGVLIGTAQVKNAGTVKLAGTDGVTNMGKITNGGEVIITNMDASKDLISLDSATLGKELKTVTIEGNVVKVGASAGSYDGAITVLDGATLQFTYEQLSMAAGGLGAVSHITVDKGGTLDVHSNHGKFGITLNGGTLANSSAKQTLGSEINLPVIDVTADSSVSITGGALNTIASGYNTSTINLNGHTLTKTGGGTWNMYSPTINGGGTIKVAEGTLEMMGQAAGKPNVVANGVTIDVAENATFIAGNHISFTLGNITGDGTVWLRNGRTINLTEGVTDIATIQAGGGATHVVYMNVAEEATLKAPTQVTQGELRINGTGTFDLGNEIAKSEKIRLGQNWAGVATVADAVVEGTDVIDATGLVTDKSSLSIDGLTVKKGGELTIAGNVAMAGALDLEDSITSSGAEVSFGTDTAIDLVGMESTVNEAGEIVFTLFDGDAVDLTTLTESNLTADTLALGGTASPLARAATGWTFGSDGTIILAAMTLEWLDTVGDDSAAGANWTGGSALRSGASLLFAGNGAGDVVIDKTATVKNVSVTAGDYNITSNGTDTLTIAGDVTVSGGSLTKADGLSMGGSYKQTAGTLDTTSLTVGETGTISISGGTVQNSTGTESLVVSGATIGTTTVSNVELKDSTIDGQLTMAGDLTLAGTITIDKSKFTPGVDIVDETVYAPGTSSDPGTSADSGFATTAYIATIITGGVATEAEGLTWADSGTPDAIIGFDAETGTVTVSGTTQSTEYYANAGVVTTYSQENLDMFTNQQGLAATQIVLNGGALALDDEAWDNTMENGIEVVHVGESSIELGETAELNKSKLTAYEDRKALLTGTGTYNLENSIELGTGVSLHDAWEGTVATGDVAGSALDITALGTGAQSSIQMGTVAADSITSGSQAHVTATGDMLLASGDSSSIAGDLTTEKALTLGTASTSATLTVAGALDAQDGISYANAASKVVVGSLAGDVLDIKVEGDALAALNEADGGTTILTSVTEFTGETWLNGATPAPEYGAKYFSTLTWTESSAGADAEGDTAAPSYDLVFDAVANENWLKEALSEEGGNAVAGGTILDEAFAATEPQKTAPDSDIAKLLDSMDALLAAGDTAGAGNVAAAAAGASIAATGMALSGDVDRQLSSIRNRTTTMGVNQYVVNEDMPYFNAWINAEGNHNELDGSGTKSGYKLDNWGGTIGMDVDFSPSLTAGLAVTAMYGDFSADGPDSIEGDMDTYYVSAFARIADSAWTHTFVGTFGKADMSMTRTVSHANGSYETDADTEGLAFGLMYELGYVIPLAEDGSTCLQPIFNVAYRHARLDGYTEKGGNAALDVDSQALNTITFGAGARLQTIIGENLYNRASMLELRALVKVDAGDREGEVETVFAGGNAKGKVKSEELGAVGVELGAGLNIPLGQQSGTLFIDGGVEFRSGYTDINGTIGWRINF